MKWLQDIWNRIRLEIDYCRKLRKLRKERGSYVYK